LNYNPANSPNSQDLPEIYSLTYGVNIISREALEKNKNIIGQRPKFYILDGIESIDIDNMEEFEMAEYFYKRLLK
jgi:CMP-N,N'-diacetyllegionaminic acid synthase